MNQTLPMEADKLLKDLHDAEASKRKAAAEELSHLAESNEVVVGALINVLENDP